VKWSEGFRNRVSIIIRRYTDHMKSYCFFHILLVLLCITVYMVVCFVCFYLILYIMYSYCYVCSVLGNVFHGDVLCIIYVQMCVVLLPPAVNPIAFTTYIKLSVSCLIPVRLQTILWLVLSVYPAFGGHLIAHAFRNSMFTAPHVCYNVTIMFNHLTPNGHFSSRIAPLTYRCCIFYLFNKYTY
jgi:hypothetical protein